ncbi:maleylacetate reductase [Sphaerisporangium krabiense]|uniref:Maleylacetate reductase n=1 Tax=Sphaerisporangium krabiense TaxID=763782 RepID=A0A7W9DP50_9ACTN|nr:maleylacetate reductase [Sphaerisporangium krabiense]MBB5626062.1 maleylacetate reductase [Sphaerisporangium krabiense]GII64866.1 maleylacetate reductase [Sphaerisporangium krabiense]
MTDAFTYEALPMRVVFGAGSVARLPEEAERIGARRLLVLSTPEQRGLADRVAGLLGERAVGVFDRARMHVPVETVAAAEQVAAGLAVDGCVAAGGGSTIGLGKALALRRGLPVLALPTTYAGSEMTPIWGLTENARKRTGRAPVVLPRAVLYDPDLTVTLPAAVSLTSGLNAVAHAVEALYAPDGSPVVAAMAEQGVRDLATALPLIARDPGDRAGRTAALRGAWLCGACLGATTMGLHHKLCHVLGGMLDLPHAETHAVMLPHVAAYNLPAAPAAAAALRRSLGAGDAAAGLAALTARLGVPTSLRELGVAEGDLARVADEVLADPYANPRPVTRPDLVALLRAAWTGGTP